MRAPPSRRRPSKAEAIDLCKRPAFFGARAFAIGPLSTTARAFFVALGHRRHQAPAVTNSNGWLRGRGMMLPLWGVLLCGACGPEVPTESWSASDHAHPPQQATQTGPAQARPARNVSPAENRARAAASLYRVSCARCHGTTGAGDGPEAPAGLPDLRTAAWQDSHDDTAIEEVIRLGRPPMPAFGDQIQPEGIVALREHVRRLRAE